jgi:4-amino-4-deoxy-L-arabinose transferase-like glycosyltransferase
MSNRSNTSEGDQGQRRRAIEIRVDFGAFSPGTRRALLLVAILLLGLGLRLAYFTGCVGTDDLAYSIAAQHMVSGEYFQHLSIGTPLTTTRLAIVAPLAGIYAILGVSEPASVLYPLLCSLCGIVLVFLAGSKVFTPRTGLFAAFLLAITPLDIYYSTIMLPDIVQAAFGILCLYLFIAARDQRGSRAAVSLLVSGLALGVCISIKENAWLLAAALAFGAAVEAIGRRWRWQLLLVVLGAAIAVGAESAILWAATGDPLFRYKVTAASAGQYERQFIPAAYGAAAAAPVMSKLLSKFLAIFAPRQSIGLAGLLAVIALIWHAVQRRFNWQVLIAAWILLAILGAAYTDVRYFSYQPRRLLPALHPSLILVAALVCETVLARRARIQLAAAAGVVALLVTPLFVHREQFYRGLMADVREAYAFLDRAGWDRRVLADPRAAPLLQFYGGFRPKRTAAALPANAEQTENAYVVLSWRWINFYERTGRPVPSYVHAIPDWWHRVRSFYNPSTKLATDIYVAGANPYRITELSVNNGGFENSGKTLGAKPDGWWPYSATGSVALRGAVKAEARTGRSAALLTGHRQQCWLLSGSGAAPPQIPVAGEGTEVEGGRLYRLSLWARSDVPTDAALWAFVSDPNGGVTAFPLAHAKITDQRYTPLSGTLMPSAPGRLRIGLRMASCSRALVDDVHAWRMDLRAPRDPRDAPTPRVLWRDDLGPASLALWAASEDGTKLTPSGGEDGSASSGSMTFSIRAKQGSAWVDICSPYDLGSLPPFSGTITYKLEGWKEVRYVAPGVRVGKKFYGQLDEDPPQGLWVSSTFSSDGMAEFPAGGIGHLDRALVRVVVKGTPGPNAKINIGSITLEERTR